MSTPTTVRTEPLVHRPRDERRLPWYHLVFTGLAGLLVAIAVLAIVGALSVTSAILLGFVLHLLFGWGSSLLREGPRWATDRLMTLLVIGAFAISMFPLVSLLWSVISRGLVRVVAAKPTTFAFWTEDMSGIIGGADAGGVFHAIVGTLLITLWASIISIPVGLFTAIFLVEYANVGWKRTLGRGVTFLVDVMTGIPSIVAGLFGLAVFIAFMPDQSVRMGIMGAVALSLLMIPTVVRNSEEMLRLVPMDLREAAYALGVPKWLTIVKVVLRTAIAGLTTGITLAINQQYRNGSANCMSDTVTNPINQEVYACAVSTNIDRAWAAAFTLIVIVMVLNIIARMISHYFSPKLSR